MNLTEPHVWESVVPPALQFSLGVLGNGIALAVIFFSKHQHKWRPFYRLVAALALTDGGGILLVYPTVMIRYTSNFTYDFPDALCGYSSFVFSFAILCSAMLIFAMSLDRFMAIVYPFMYKSGNKYRRVNITLIVIFTTSAVVCMLHLVGVGSTYNFYPGSWCFFDFAGNSSADLANSCIYSLLGLTLLFTTFLFNIIVIVNLCRNKANRNRKKNIMFLMTLLTMMSMLWTPLIIVILAHAVGQMSGQGERELLVLRLAVSNSIVDPWIYILVRRETLEAIRRFLKMTKGNLYGLCLSPKKIVLSKKLSSESRTQCFTETSDSIPSNTVTQTNV